MYPTQFLGHRFDLRHLAQIVFLACLERFLITDFLETSGLVVPLHELGHRIAHLDDVFDFVGWHYKGHQSWPRKKSVKALRLELREKTRRLRSGSMEAICDELKPILNGWMVYFGEGNSDPTFGMASGWTRRRLRSILQGRHKEKGIGSRWLNCRWPNRCFARWGLPDLGEDLKRYHRLSHAPSP